MALKNLILMATGVVESAKSSRDDAIAAAKTEVLGSVKDSVVDEAVKAKLGVANGIADLAKAADVSAAATQATTNAAAIGNIEDEIDVITENVKKKADADKVYTKEEVDSKVSQIPKFGVEVVDSLPAAAEADESKIYLVRTSDSLGSNNIFTEYIVVNGIFEQLGTQELDLSGYATKEELANYVLTSDLFKNGYFDTVYNHADGSYAKMWNESDGGGSMYFNKGADVISYVGTNDGGAGADAVNVQIYSKNKTSNSGVRLNVNSQKIYYTKGANTTANGGDENNELAVKGDIPDVSGFANAADVYTQAEVDQKINDAIADVLEQIRTEFASDNNG